MIETDNIEPLRIIVMDDNKEIVKDFRKILDPELVMQNAAIAEIEKKLFDSELKQTADTSFIMPRFNLFDASQGQEGVETIKKAFTENKRFSLAFVDIRMPPGWDGIQTIEEIWKIDPWVQVVICTAYSDYSWDEMVERLGLSDNLLILKKPFDIVEVRQLAYALTEKWLLNAQLQKHVENLELTIKERTKALEKSLTLLRTTLEATADGIMVENLNGEIIECNNVFLTMWNISEEFLKNTSGKKVLQLNATQLLDPQAFLSKIEYLNKNFELESIDELNLKDGRCFEHYCKPHRVGEQIVGRVWSFRDISEQKKMHRELLYQATHDILTNLPNRSLLYDRIIQSIALAKRYNKIIYILLFDLDKFKLINDSLGHTAGDSVLKLVAKRVSEIIRESDTLSRLGGDEFVVVLNEANDQTTPEVVAQKIIDVISTPFKLFNYEFSLTTSLGISMYPKDGKTTEELIRKADAAMYAVKSTGRNQFKFYEENITQPTLALLIIENDLKKSLELNQLKLYYQPIIEIATGAVAGVEALIRWEHPTLGNLMPEAFLQIAEETGLIVPIGEWVLRTACLQMKKWQDEKRPPLKLAVNVSSTQFRYPFFDTIVQKILTETKLKPEFLELELTETTIIANPTLMIEMLKKIRKIGIELVVDDFGTGYSSLSYLKQFPFSKLKIDKLFINGIDANADDASLVQTIIAMGNNLKLRVVAEGVETEGQLALLKKYKCDQAQGFLFSEAVSSDKLVSFLNAKD